MAPQKQHQLEPGQMNEVKVSALKRDGRPNHNQDEQVQESENRKKDLMDY